jgi:hypothetical protein
MEGAGNEKHTAYYSVLLTRINQLPLSDTRWLHGSWICFVTFIQCKIKKLPITQQPLKLEKMKTDLVFLEF